MQNIRKGFQSTLPGKGATLASSSLIVSGSAFQSTLPVKGATMMFVSIRSLAIFQSTLPVKGATQLFYADGWGNFISIHAPREGSDRDTAKKPIIIGVFQSTLPVKGATIVWQMNGRSLKKFQSTLPVKGATAMLTNFSVTIVQLSANSTNFSL